MSGWAAPGSAGELVQGWLDDGPIHITAPIDRFSVATFDPKGSFDPTAGSPKTRQAIDQLFRDCGLAPYGRLSLQSDLPHGKGMGSSTADICAALAAVADAIGMTLLPADLARIAVSVEPTDGTMFPGVALFGHCQGSRLELLGDPPEAAIVLIDEGGKIDTVDHHQRLDLAAVRRGEASTREAVAMAREAIHTGDRRLLGQAATLSARANQAILPKRWLDEVIAVSDALGADGVCVAHSGTVLGLIVDPARATAIAAALPWPAEVVRLIGGGVRSVLAPVSAVLV